MAPDTLKSLTYRNGRLLFCYSLVSSSSKRSWSWFQMWHLCLESVDLVIQRAVTIGEASHHQSEKLKRTSEMAKSIPWNVLKKKECSGHQKTWNTKENTCGRQQKNSFLSEGKPLHNCWPRPRSLSRREEAMRHSQQSREDFISQIKGASLKSRKTTVEFAKNRLKVKTKPLQSRDNILWTPKDQPVPEWWGEESMKKERNCSRVLKCFGQYCLLILSPVLQNLPDPATQDQSWGKMSRE